MKFLFINGVNLNLTGYREKSVYGGETLEEINSEIAAYAAARGDEAEFYQSNIEGEICSRLHEAFFKGGYDGIILNVGAFSHYSYAIREAVAAINIPVVEVHMSNIFSREEFRRRSVIAEACVGMIAGFGKNSYILALEGLKNLAEK